jgi:hypothetical protein
LSKPAAFRGWVCALFTVSVLAIVAVAMLTLSPAARGKARSAASAAPKAAVLTPAARGRVQASYAALPLSFEANQGQTDSKVKYMARGDGYTLFLTADDAVFSLQSHASKKAKSERRSQKVSTAVVHMQLNGGNAQAAVSASSQLPGRSNYFLGNDPSKWHSDVPHFARVSYQHVYPGVNLAFHGAQRQTEFDFVVAPGANPAPIGFHFTGARGIKTDASGNLIISSTAGNVQLHKPVAYQEQNGTRQLVDASFVLKADNQIAFELGSYDRSHELVIDPSVSVAYSTYLGGSGDDEGQGIAIDSTGAIYVTGQTASANFPGATTTSLKDTASVFVTKIAPDGSTLDYSVYVGGSSGTGSDNGFGIAVDGSGNAFVAGGTSSTNFPVTTGAFQTKLNGTKTNAFVFKLSPSGTILYSTYLGGTGADNIFGIALATDSSGDVFVGGRATSTDFPITASHVQGYLTGAVSSGFVAKLSPGGNGTSDLVYSTYLGGSTTTGDFDGVNAVAVDAADNVYVTGQTFSLTYPFTLGAFQTACNSCTGGNDNAFLTQINVTKNTILYSTYLGGSGSDEGNGIAVDPQGSVYITGATTSSDFPHGTAPFGGVTDAFVTKLTPAGTGASDLVYSIFVGGSGLDAGAGIALDGFNNAYITGQTASTSNFPTVNPTQSKFGGGVADAFVSEVGASGTLVFSTYLGGSGLDDSGNLGAIAVDSAGANIYVTGNTIATSGTPNNFPTQAPFPYAGGNADAGGTNAFVVKYTQGTSPTFSLTATALSPATVSPGGSATSTVTVTPAMGFSGPVTLSCAVTGPAGAAHLPTCAAATATPGTPGTLTVNTTAASALLERPATRRSGGMFYAMLLPMGGIALLFGSAGTQRKKLFGFLLVGLVLGSLLLMPACGGSSSSTGGGGSPGTTAGTYTVTVTGTATGATQTGTAPALTLTVN